MTVGWKGFPAGNGGKGWQRWALAASAAVLLGLGGSAAFAASPAPASASTGFWAQVAQKVGVSPAQLINAIQATQIARLQTVAARRHWSSSQVQRATARIQHEHLGLPQVVHPLPGLKLRTVLRIAARALHMTPGQLAQALQQDHTLAAVASAQHSTPSALQQAMLGTLNAHVEKAVTGGHLSATQAARREHHDQMVVARWMNRDLQHVHWQQPWSRVFTHRAAAFLGMSNAQFRQAVARGQTPAQLAQAHGKTATALVGALLAPTQTRLQKAEAAGHLSAAAAQARLARLTALVTAWIQHVPSAPSSSPSPSN